MDADDDAYGNVIYSGGPVKSEHDALSYASVMALTGPSGIVRHPIPAEMVRAFERNYPAPDPRWCPESER